MPFDWGGFGEGLIEGGLSGYLAGSSSGRRPGVAGWAEAVIRPEEVMKRGRYVDAINEATPYIDEIQKLAEAGNFAEAQQRMVQISSTLLRSGVSPDIVQHVVHTAAQPVLAAQERRYVQDQMKGVDLSTPEGANKAAELMLRIGGAENLPGAATLAQGAAKTAAQARLTGRREERAEEGLRLRQQQAESTLATGALSRENLQSLMAARKERLEH